MGILRRTQQHLVGRVATVAAAVTFSAMASVALLPLTMRVLHASDYGTYAVLMSIVALVSAALDGTATLLLPAVYGPASTRERGRAFVSIAGFAAIGAGVAGLLLTGLWFWQHVAFTEQPLPMLFIALSAVLMPLRAVTTVAVVVFTVTGRSGAIAAQMIGQAMAVFAGTLIALFGFGMGGASLFIGAMCGQLCAMAICLFVLGCHRELGLPCRDWIRRAAAKAPASAASAFANGARCFFENVTLTGVSGLHAVGILSHARLYYTMLTGIGGSVAQSVCAKSLEEARNPHAQFKTTRSAWVPMQMAFGCAGLIFVFFGKEIVDTISNGKLTDAADYVPALLVIGLIQITSQPATAIVLASGHAAAAAWFRSAVVMATLALLYPAVLLFGIKGILVLCVVEAATYRLYLRMIAARHRDVPFQDEVALLGCAAIVLGMAIVHVVHPSLGVQIVLLLTGMAVLGTAGRDAVAEMIAGARRLALRPAGGRPVVRVALQPSKP
jgi:O-antigen/teichoic acid export membrane protein